jgi:hypothetical protein
MPARYRKSTTWIWAIPPLAAVCYSTLGPRPSVRWTLAECIALLWAFGVLGELLFRLSRPTIATSAGATRRPKLAWAVVCLVTATLAEAASASGLAGQRDFIFRTFGWFAFSLAIVLWVLPGVRQVIWRNAA